MHKYFVALCIFCAFASSVCYHMIERHKHGMRGINIFCDKTSHHIFLNIDRFFACLLVYVMFDIKYIYHVDIVLTFIIGLLCMGLSEMVFKGSQYQMQYIVTHCLWHIFAFHTVYIALKY